MEKLLSEIIDGIFYLCIKGTTNIYVKDICDDSRLVTKQSVFVCIIGNKTDGHHYIKEAIDKGATAIIVGCPFIYKKYENENIVWIFTPDTRFALGKILCRWYDDPAKKMQMIGITGTKGKTTTAYMIYHILKNAGYKTGLISTIKIDTGKQISIASMTTPSAVLLQKFLYEMVCAGVEIAVIEVSSLAVKQQRIAGILFDYGILLNIYEDHIGNAEHKDLDEYIFYKGHFLDYCKNVYVNEKNALACRVAKEKMKSRIHDLIGYNLNLTSTLNLKMIGEMNLENASAAITIAKTMGVPIKNSVESLTSVTVPGRMERISFGLKPEIYIDYAHNEVALRQALSTLKKECLGNLICVFGCGGNRSHIRRFNMGKVSGCLADYTVITSDNPRYESVEKICKEIAEGVETVSNKYVIIKDRKEAINHAMYMAKKDDIILLAGKGHEQYQEIDGVKYYFNEKEYILSHYL